MEALRCPNCGGAMELVAAGRYKCKFCKKESVINNDSGELVFALNTAARYRSKKDFDSAMEEYERAIGIDPTCSDAYWGMFLSEYGIEFVEDPQSGEYKPTICHRIQTTSVENNINFKKAIELAPVGEQDGLIAMSRQIDVVREQLLSMSGNMPDYDIFICYKQNEDDSKTPTKESAWARDMYYQLIGNGYKVFYAEQSLADKEGEYEANIYAALNSARVMLILASDLEHVNATWVKNEWSRFVKLAKDNQSKSFKVVMSGFEPEALPVALRSQQVIRKDDIDWWDKVRLFIDNIFSKDDAKAREIDEKAKKRLADFNAMRERAVKARQNTQETLSASEILRNKKKNDAIARVRSAVSSNKYNIATDRGKEYIGELKRELLGFLDDFECAKLYFLLSCSLYCEQIITDEASLIDYAIPLKKPGYHDPETDTLYRACNGEEREYFKQIASICQDNYQAETELKSIEKLMEEGLYSDAYTCAQKAAQDHPMYGKCWETVLCAKYHCKDANTLYRTNTYQIYENKEYEKSQLIRKHLRREICDSISACEVGKKEKKKYTIMLSLSFVFLLLIAIGAVLMCSVAYYAGLGIMLAGVVGYFVCTLILLHLIGWVKIDDDFVLKLIAGYETPQFALWLPFVLAFALIPVTNWALSIRMIIKSSLVEKRAFKYYHCKSIEELEAMIKPLNEVEQAA